MNVERMTLRVQQALNDANLTAVKYNHQQIEVIHLFSALVEAEDGLIPNIFTKMGINIKMMLVDIKNILDKMPKVMGEGANGSGVYITRQVEEVLVKADDLAKKFGDSYISVEHLILAIIDVDKNGPTKQILNKYNVTKDNFMKVLSEVRGSQRVDTQDPEGTYDALAKYGTNLVELAKKHKLDPVIGRDDEIRRTIRILSRRTKNNPVLIGEPGVGKTAIIEGLAQKIISGDAPESLRDKRLLTLDITSMIAGAKYRGEFEERLKKVMNELKNEEDIIIFIDEIHTIVGAGGAEGAIDASNILKPALARGEIKCIGATTIDEYRKHIEKDAALERRFQTVNVEPPSKDETLNILFGLRDKYESHHKVKITDSALYMAVDLADKYISDRYMPDKAIDLIDEAASKVRISRLTFPPEIKKKELDIEKVISEKEDTIRNQDFEKAANLRDKEKQLKEEFEKIKNEWRAHSCTEVQIVDEDDIAKVVAIWTKVPVERLTEKESDKLLHLEETLRKRVVGQQEAIKALVRAVKRARVGLKNPNRPIGTFIFCGPTGVGKTELCNVLAEVMFGKVSNLIRVDMSEYMEKHSVSRLIGAPPGYVGYEEGGQLSEAVRRKPYSVVLLDEIEKAHPDVFNILLQIMEDGRLTDGKGKTIDFKNTIVIMTSNVGAQKIKSQRKVGFDTSLNSIHAEYEKIKDVVLEELKKAFKPEFLNRVDDTIVFNQLKEEDTLEIVNIMLKDTIKILKEKNIDLIYDEDLNKFLVTKNKNLEFGARPLRGIINREIVDRLSDELLKGEIKVGDKLKVECKEEGVIFSHR